MQVTGTVQQIIQTDVESVWEWDFNNDETTYLVERELDLAVLAKDVQELPKQ